MISAWVLFHVFVFGMLALDLGVFHKKAHEVRFREAITWTGIWVTLAMLFCVGVYFQKGPASAMEFLTAYLVEESLSIDNVFIILLIFKAFHIPGIYQHRVLFWGILGAIVMRLGFILAGVELINRFHWIIYVFGAFLVFTGIKMAMPKKEDIDIEKNMAIRLLRRFFPVTTQLHGQRFFVPQGGKLAATPLFVALVMVETSDLVFALDSIPAVLAISRDSFIVYTSNIFAILGLRSLFFAISGIMQLFHYIQYGLAAVLVFVGIKMAGADFFHIPSAISLIVIATLIGASIGASILWPKKGSSKP